MTSAQTDAMTSPPNLQRARVPVAPRRWKLWLLVTLGVYPIITALDTAADPILRHLVRAAHFAVVVPIMVAVMVWGVIPLIHRCFGAWLRR
jgi:hypothetical protein